MCDGLTFGLARASLEARGYYGVSGACQARRRSKESVRVVQTVACGGLLVVVGASLGGVAPGLLLATLDQSRRGADTWFACSKVNRGGRR